MMPVAAAALPADLLPLLRCPGCGSGFDAPSAAEAPVALVCRRCRLHVPIVRGVPRFVADESLAGTARRTQESFGYEWTHFSDWRHSGATNFADYFQGLDLHTLGAARVLDAGCGMGRHARQMAPFARSVVAVDFSRAIDQAARNTADRPNVWCLQADLLALPLAPASFDLVYSLGVLHHLTETERALAGLVRLLKPGGRLRVYLYWTRHGWSGTLLRGVTAARRITTRLPFPLLRGLCRVLSVGLYAGIVLPYRLLASAGVRRHQSWPLFVYTKYPFAVLDNDQFDRFSAPLERRYDAGEVRDLLRAAGLREVTVRPCAGWIGEGVKPL